MPQEKTCEKGKFHYLLAHGFGYFSSDLAMLENIPTIFVIPLTDRPDYQSRIFESPYETSFCDFYINLTKSMLLVRLFLVHFIKIVVLPFAIVKGTWPSCWGETLE